MVYPAWCISLANDIYTRNAQVSDNFAVRRFSIAGYVRQIMKDIDLFKLPPERLRNLIANHRKKGETSSKLYLDAMGELEARTGRGLDFDKSFEVIRRAAKEHRFVSYKELADASGAEWSRVHYEIGGHLWRLVEYAWRRGWPMLSAIVVNKQNTVTGAMEPETLKGFLRAARDLGYVVTDEDQFLREQQDEVFNWAQASEG
jgi:hypothetical protein